MPESVVDDRGSDVNDTTTKWQNNEQRSRTIREPVFMRFALNEVGRAKIGFLLSSRIVFTSAFPCQVVVERRGFWWFWLSCCCFSYFQVVTREIVWEKRERSMTLLFLSFFFYYCVFREKQRSYQNLYLFRKNYFIKYQIFKISTFSEKKHL